MVKKSTQDSSTGNESAAEASFNLEATLDKLEDIVATLEDGELPLEKAMQQFELGVSLSQRCQQALGEAQQKVQELVETNGDFALKAYSPEDG